MFDAVIYRWVSLYLINFCMLILHCFFSLYFKFIVWANHGDEISLQYSGTPALKGDFVRYFCIYFSILPGVYMHRPRLEPKLDALGESFLDNIWNECSFYFTDHLSILVCLKTVILQKQYNAKKWYIFHMTHTNSKSHIKQRHISSCYDMKNSGVLISKLIH